MMNKNKENSHLMEADLLLLPVGPKREPINPLVFHFLTRHLLLGAKLLTRNAEKF